MTLLLILCSIVMLIGGNTEVHAKEFCTPSGIEYSSIENELDQYVKKYEDGLASLAISFFDREGLLTNKYYGYSDIENQVLADENTVYDWGRQADTNIRI